MNLKLTAQAYGSNILSPLAPDKVLPNGDFTIVSNPGASQTGDGIDESTTWSFDLKGDSDWGDFDLNRRITKARLVITSSPKRSDLNTDRLGIDAPGLELQSPQAIYRIPVGETRTIDIDLLESGYNSDQILQVLRDNNGVLPMKYQDDSIISFAGIEIAQKITTLSGGGSTGTGSSAAPASTERLIVTAASEDTVAAPGNQRENYLLLSVTDHLGNPVTNLSASDIKVDAMLVGPGGSLVEIDSVRHSARIDGFYYVNLKPMTTTSWKSGVYVFGVAVESGSRRGQALATVQMD